MLLSSFGNKHFIWSSCGSYRRKFTIVLNFFLTKYALATYGPLVVPIDASLPTFQFYKSGVFKNPLCGSRPNHAVLLVGYGTQNGQDYWLIKNSWGISWGYEGYMKLARGKNSCVGEYALVLTA